MANPDLTDLLKSWPYEAGRINARRIVGTDGRAKIQVRIDLGVLQMEATGRPDGRTPAGAEGFESLLEYQIDRRDRYVRETGSAHGFVLSAEECRTLREEAVQYYHRYVANFSLGDYAAVVHDTQRNLRLFDLCHDAAATEGDRVALEQFRPYVITMRTRAQAELAVVAGRPKEALAAIDGALEELRGIFDEAGLAEEFDRAGEVQLLRGMRDALVPKLPTSQRVELQDRLRAAIEAENYELAAILRDELRLMEG